MSYRKYNNNMTTVDKIKFASRREATRYSELKLLERAGKISGLELQPSFILQESFDKNNRHYRAITYKADFQYFDIEKGKMIVEDTKGFQTQVYRLKKKLFEKTFPDMTITEV